MRKASIIFILFVAHSLFAGDVPDSLYNEAGEAYAAGKFEQALDLYREIEEMGYEAADLYYNMGNASFRSNRPGYAILYYNKALKINPRHTEARSNLDYVSLFREDQLENVPEFFLKSWFRSLFSMLPLKAWSYLALTFFLFILAGILFYIFGSHLSLKKTGFAIALVSILFFTISIAAAVNHHRKIIHPRRAIILTPSVVVKSSPSSSGTDLFILHEGTGVNTDEHVGEWVEIRISDGRVGWIPSESLEVI
ncbi:MAG: tetratricopeptide repeat protein [Bacteroidales bacterium]|nr:tetratricopeptide repeat protein [Bacteroidales bacterium]